METSDELIAGIGVGANPTTSSEVELMETFRLSPYLIFRQPNNFFGSRINGNAAYSEALKAEYGPNNFFGSRINGNGS